MIVVYFMCSGEIDVCGVNLTLKYNTLTKYINKNNELLFSLGFLYHGHGNLVVLMQNRWAFKLQTNELIFITAKSNYSASINQFAKDKRQTLH